MSRASVTFLHISHYVSQCAQDKRFQVAREILVLGEASDNKETMYQVMLILIPVAGLMPVQMLQGKINPKATQKDADFEDCKLLPFQIIAKGFCRAFHVILFLLIDTFTMFWCVV